MSTCSGGNNLVVGRLAGSTGTYTFNDGTLDVTGNATVGNNATSTGLFDQAAGAVTVTGTLDLGGGAGGGGETYIMDGGTLDVTGAVSVGVAAAAIFDHNDGAADFSSTLDVGAASAGEYRLSGSTATSTLTVTGLTTVGSADTGLVTQDGGTANLNGGLDIGAGALGTYAQTAGAVNVTGDVNVGDGFAGSNAYNISGGTLGVTGNANLGSTTQGTMDVSGTAAVDIDGNANIGGAATGLLNISAGSVNVDGDAFVAGAAGDGTVDQSGGTATVHGNMTVNAGAGTGLYRLSGGVLSFNDRDGVSQATNSEDSTLTLVSAGASNTVFTFQDIAGVSGGALENVTTINVDSTGDDTFTQDGGDLVVGNDGLTNSTADTPMGERATTSITGGYLALLDGAGVAPTLSVDIFGDQDGEFRLSPNFGREQELAEPAISSTDVLTGSPTASDLLIVDGIADLQAGFTLDVNVIAGVTAPFLGYYDVLLADQILVDEDTFQVQGLGLWRITTLSDGSQVLQVAAPEPASIAVWSLLAALAAGVHYRRRRVRRQA